MSRERPKPVTPVAVSDRTETVISVPHSGTRTLCVHLWPGAETYNYIHWGQNDADIGAFTGIAHIPIRNPIDIARTWDGRYPSAAAGGNHCAVNMLWRLDLMLDYIENNRPRVRLYRIEDIPDVVGQGEPRRIEETHRVAETRKWLSGKLGFYNQFNYEFD